MTTESSNAESGDQKIPHHVAIIMDGNGRWAEARHQPRVMGHRAGVEAVRLVVEECARRGVHVLTLFAFSSENWKRPEQEVGLLMDLFMTALGREVSTLNENNVRLRMVGGIDSFSKKLQAQIHKAEQITHDNTGLELVVAVNYGGRWDITQAAQQLAAQVEQGLLKAEDITAERLAGALVLHDLPDPDLFIRTGGEHRVSNFLLWQLAYTELFFTDTLWPDFNADCLQQAFDSYAGRQRRFGKTGKQVEQAENA